MKGGAEEGINLQRSPRGKGNEPRGSEVTAAEGKSELEKFL